jgi:Deoxyribonuclease II
VDNCAEAGSPCGDNNGQLKVAQNFACISIDVKTLNKVAETLIVPALTVFSSKVPSQQNAFPSVQALVDDHTARHGETPI